jgi:hypothetical protein
MWKFFALIGLVGSPSWGASYLCEEWSAFNGDEGGSATITVNEDSLIWSNGKVVMTADNIANDKSSWVYQGQLEIYLIPHMRAQSGPFESIVLRRVRYLGEPSASEANCRLIE